MWLHYDFGDGPHINGVKTILFMAWPAFSRFRIVIPLRDRTAERVRCTGLVLPHLGQGTGLCTER